jgi:hypothetical protein
MLAYGWSRCGVVQHEDVFVRAETLVLAPMRRFGLSAIIDA